MKRTAAAAAALPLLLLVGCGGSNSGSASPAGASVTALGPATAQTVTIDSNDSLKFDPTTVNAKVGKLTLTNTNIGRIPHNLVFDDASLGKTQTVSGGKSENLVLTFNKAGTFTFVCTFHEGMVGKIVVA